MDFLRDFLLCMVAVGVFSISTQLSELVKLYRWKLKKDNGEFDGK